MEFKKKVLKNGLTVLFEKRDVPVTTVMLAAKYGSICESIEEKGMAHFIEHLCFKGTEKRSAKQIAKEVESLGGELNAFTHEEITAYHVKLPSGHVNVAMDVIFDIFFNASFPEEEVEREANVICEEIKMYRDNPRMHVIEKIKANLYEEPFGMFIAGSEKTVKSMTRKDLFKKHRDNYVPKNSILCVVGNNNFNDIIKMTESMCVNRAGNISRIQKIKNKNIHSSETRRDVEQANLALGFHFPKGDVDSRYAAELFSSMLGRGMSSKLFEEVREKRGLVYGIKSDLDIGKNYGYMIIWAGTDNKNKQKVIDVCLEEYKKMANIVKEELDLAKVQVIGNRHVETEGSSETALNLILQEVAGDAKNYYDYEKNIKNVSLEDIKRLANIKDHSSFILSP